MFAPTKRQEFLDIRWPGLTGMPFDFSDGTCRRFDGFEIHVGRLQAVSANSWTIGWQGEKRGFSSAAKEIPLGVFSRGFTDFTELAPAAEVVTSGDLVALQVDPQGTVVAMQLLVPCEGRLERSADLAIARQWSRFLHRLRLFFIDKGFLEASTPSLVTSPGMEPHLQAFSTTLKFGRREKRFYLPTSPEFHLKKLLCQGAGKIFEIKRCFRNEESGDHHQPEFLMLEWYRSFSPLEKIAEDTRELIETLQAALFPERPPAVFQRTTMAELFQKNCGLDLRPDTKKAELEQCCRRWHLHTDEQDGWNDLFHRLYLEKVEPYLARQQAVFVFDFPPRQLDLARLNERGWSDRFEVYWQGIELCNAFHELNDWREQLRRIESANRIKKDLGLEAFPVDEEFIGNLKFGLPPSSGIALGVERLFMVLTGKSRLSEVIAFAHDLASPS